MTSSLWVIYHVWSVLGWSSRPLGSGREQIEAFPLCWNWLRIRFFGNSFLKFDFSEISIFLGIHPNYIFEFLLTKTEHFNWSRYFTSCFTFTLQESCSWCCQTNICCRLFFILGRKYKSRRRPFCSRFERTPCIQLSTRIS